jgi:hypothetical protein
MRSSSEKCFALCKIVFDRAAQLGGVLKIDEATAFRADVTYFVSVRLVIGHSYQVVLPIGTQAVRKNASPPLKNNLS